MKTHERKLKRVQRSLSRKVRGSNNREKARLRLAHIHRKIARIRLSASHKATSELVKSFIRIGLEDLNVKGMLRNHKLAKAVADASFGEIRRQIEYKAKLSGSMTVLADRFYPSSKLCSNCGHRLKKLSLKVRSWVCPACNARHDRDLNAAKNLEFVAVSHTETKNACGEGVRPKSRRRQGHPSLKQELSPSADPKGVQRVTNA